MAKIDFNGLVNHTISMKDFNLNWRFDDEKYDRLPIEYLNQLKPLDTPASEFLWNYIANSGLHSDFPFKKDFFETIDRIDIDDKQDIKKWLYQRAFPSEKLVYLSWQPTDAMIVPWKLFIKYFDSFYYSVSDDLIIIDESLNWCLFFHHTDEIYFGSNAGYTPVSTSENIDFI